MKMGTCKEKRDLLQLDMEMPSVLLMAAVRNVQITKPTLYQVVKEMIDKMGYEVRLVRVTKRVHEVYFAQLYLSKVGNEAESQQPKRSKVEPIRLKAIAKEKG